MISGLPVITGLLLVLAECAVAQGAYNPILSCYSTGTQQLRPKYFMTNAFQQPATSYDSCVDACIALPAALTIDPTSPFPPFKYVYYYGNSAASTGATSSGNCYCDSSEDVSDPSIVTISYADCSAAGSVDTTDSMTRLASSWNRIGGSPDAGVFCFNAGAVNAVGTSTTTSSAGGCLDHCSQYSSALNAIWYGEQGNCQCASSIGVANNGNPVTCDASKGLASVNYFLRDAAPAASMYNKKKRYLTREARAIAARNVKVVRGPSPGSIPWLKYSKRRSKE